MLYDRDKKKTETQDGKWKWYDQGLCFPEGVNLDGDYVGLVSLFNGISTFMGYLMPKPSL